MSGALTMDTIADCYEEHRKMLLKGESLTIDLANVQVIDSAGLALLLEWQAQARKRGGEIKVVNPSDKFLHLAALCDADQVLGMESIEGPRDATA